ncbi:hypothetical protein ACFX13_045001 [Malus domestica]
MEETVVSGCLTRKKKVRDEGVERDEKYLRRRRIKKERGNDVGETLEDRERELVGAMEVHDAPTRSYT